jgi:hypothetical protein
VGILVDEVTTKLGVLQVLRFSPVNFIPPMLHTHLRSTYWSLKGTSGGLLWRNNTRRCYERVVVFSTVELSLTTYIPNKLPSTPAKYKEINGKENLDKLKSPIHISINFESV